MAWDPKPGSDGKPSASAAMAPIDVAGYGYDTAGRLVELEMVRGEQLLSASPQLFAEIGQLESEITDLRAALQARGV